jgi:predicted PurR-regulated permease PerM
MATKVSTRSDFYRYAAVITMLVVILGGCLIVLRPFLAPLLLAAILCLSTWPVFVHLEKRLNGRTRLAALLMTCSLAVCFLVPLVFLGSSLAESFSGLVTAISNALQSGDQIKTPEWILNIPWAGTYLDGVWQEYASDRARLTQTLKDYAGPVSRWLIEFGGGIGHGIFDISLGVVIAYFFFEKGQVTVNRMRGLIRNFGGESSQRLLHVTGNTVIGVVYGILGTALVLGALATVGFLIAGVPGAPFLGLVTFVLGIIPGGPPVLLVPVTLWLFSEGHMAMGIFMALWSAAIMGVLDMVIRPYLISRGSKMPLLLVLLGVFGGVAAFGFIGLFIGPALLAIASALVTEWSYKG